MIRELAVLAEAARPELLAWVLASMRVLPVTLLCPVLGGQLVPAPARLAVAGALGLTLRPLVGVLQPASEVRGRPLHHFAAVGPGGPAL